MKLTLALVACATVVATACSGDGDPGLVSETQGKGASLVEFGEVDWALHQGASLSTMLETYPIVILATVEEGQTLFEETLPPGLDLATDRLVAGKTRISGQGSEEPFTVLTLEVLESLAGDETPGSRVAFKMWGGDVTSTDGVVQQWVYEGDRIPEAGKTYLFFVLEHDGNLVAAPWGKYRLDADRFTPLTDSFSHLGVNVAVVGKSPREVADAITAASK